MIAYNPFIELFLVTAAIVEAVFLSLDYDGIERSAELYNFLQANNKVTIANFI